MIIKDNQIHYPGSIITKIDSVLTKMEIIAGPVADNEIMIMTMIMIFSMIMTMRSYQVHHPRIMRATPCGSMGTKVISLDVIHNWTIFLSDTIHNWKIISFEIIHNWQIIFLDFIHSWTIILLNIIHNWTIILLSIIHYLI